MSKSEQIRALALTGSSTKEIAAAVNVTYQHAYNVLRQAGLLITGGLPTKTQARRPELSADTLLKAGFRHTGCWKLDHPDKLRRPEGLPRSCGVYAFATSGAVRYVGVAKTNLDQRIYFYTNPGLSQRTNIRLRQLIVSACATCNVELLIAQPDDLEWNGLPVSGCAGLEIGLISRYSLAWNVQGTERA